MATTESVDESAPISNVSEAHTIQLKVLTLDQRSHLITIASDASVPQLKAVVETKTGIRLARQRLIFRGKVLKNDQLIAEYALEDGHVLHLVARAEPPVSSTPLQSTGDTSQGADRNSTQRNGNGRDTTTGDNDSRPNRFVMGATIAVPEGTNIGMPFLNSFIANLVTSIGSNASSTTDRTNASPEEMSVGFIIDGDVGETRRENASVNPNSSASNATNSNVPSEDTNFRFVIDGDFGQLSRREEQLRHLSRVANMGLDSNTVNRAGIPDLNTPADERAESRRLRSQSRTEYLTRNQNMREGGLSSSQLVQFLRAAENQMLNVNSILSNSRNTPLPLQEANTDLDEYDSLQRAWTTWHQLVEQIHPRMELLPSALRSLRQNEQQSSEVYESRATIEMLSIVGNVAAEISLLARAIVENIAPQDRSRAPISNHQELLRRQASASTTGASSVTVSTSRSRNDGTPGILQSIYERMASTFRGSSSRETAVGPTTIMHIPSSVLSSTMSDSIATGIDGQERLSFFQIAMPRHGSNIARENNRWNVIRLWEQLSRQFTDMTTLRLSRGDPLTVNELMTSIVSVLTSGDFVPPVQLLSARTWSRRFWIEVRHSVMRQGLPPRLLEIIPDRNGLDFMNQITRGLSPFMPELMERILRAHFSRFTRVDEALTSYLRRMASSLITRITTYMHEDETATQQLLEAILVTMGFGDDVVSLVVSRLLRWVSSHSTTSDAEERRRRRDETDDSAATPDAAKRQRRST